MEQHCDVLILKKKNINKTLNNDKIDNNQMKKGLDYKVDDHFEVCVVFLKQHGEHYHKETPFLLTKEACLSKRKVFNKLYELAGSH